MKLVGEIVRLQIQTDRLIQGERPYRTYTTGNLQTVPAMRLTATGVIGLRDGVEQLDVHHADHPNSGYRDGFGISLGITAHYEQMRGRFGGHITPGCAGENVIVAAAVPLTLDELAAGLMIVTADGREIELERPSVIPPCEPFSRFCLQADDRPPALAMKETLQFLDNGMRGFGVVLVGETAVIRPGDKLFLAG